MIEQAALEGETKTDAYRWNLLQKKAQEIRIGQAFSLFRSHGIEPVLIKGWAIGRLYPPTKPRISVDIDIAVSAADYGAAERIAKSSDDLNLALDLHRELRHLDTLKWQDLFDNSQMIDVDGVQVRVLCPEDHLRVLCVHWLTDGGEFKERLWDIVYLIENRTPDFDWDRCLNVVSQTRRRWILCTIGLAHRYLDLDLTGTPIANEVLDLPAWLANEIEREWASDIRLIPVEMWHWNAKLLFQQVRKRFPPGPIIATVQMEGSFDSKTRIFYRFGNIFQRIAASYRRITLNRRLRRNESVR